MSDKRAPSGADLNIQSLADFVPGAPDGADRRADHRAEGGRAWSRRWRASEMLEPIMVPEVEWRPRTGEFRYSSITRRKS